MTTQKSKRGTNPNSLKNLELGGRTPLYEENKRGCEISITDTARSGLKAIAQSFGLRSNISELAEQIGRKRLTVVQLPEEAIAALGQIGGSDRAYITAAVMAKLEADGLLEGGDR